eukprot:3419880-Alexandrium_andersonii.AAC.1
MVWGPVSAHRADVEGIFRGAPCGARNARCQWPAEDAQAAEEDAEVIVGPASEVCHDGGDGCIS